MNLKICQQYGGLCDGENLVHKIIYFADAMLEVLGRRAWRL
jgi:hypothetical protein